MPLPLRIATTYLRNDEPVGQPKPSGSFRFTPSRGVLMKYRKSIRTQPPTLPVRTERGSTLDGLRVSISRMLANPMVLPGDKGLYNGQRGQKDRKCSSQRQGEKRAARRFYFSCQHPITNQQFALTTKLSKKRHRLGHLSNGLRRSQLSAQETEKKKNNHPSISHITFLLKHDKEENIWQKRPKRGKTEINRI